MRCAAIIEANRPGLDSVILWETDDHQLIAFAYLDGQVTMTRPTAAYDLDGAINEVRQNFQINEAQLTRIHNWRDDVAITERISMPRTRWQ